MKNLAIDQWSIDPNDESVMMENWLINVANDKIYLKQLTEVYIQNNNS